MIFIFGIIKLKLLIWKYNVMKGKIKYDEMFSTFYELELGKI